MNRQMDIFDFIEKLPEIEKKPPKTQFEQIFEKVREPVIKCVNCLCQHCANNVEGDIKPGEIQEPCFNCDYCSVYDRGCGKQNQCKEECLEFVISDYGARRNRKRIRVMKKKEVIREWEERKNETD